MAISSSQILSLFDQPDNIATPNGLPALPAIGSTSAPSNFIGTPGLQGAGVAANSNNPLNFLSPLVSPSTLFKGLTNSLSIGNSTIGGALGDSLGLNTSNSNLNAANQSAKISSTSTWSDFFLRGVVIILGFIFVAVGLSMFKGSDVNIILKKTGLK
jgi:hypothetical protein